jgi:hypothetical protein
MEIEADAADDCEGMVEKNKQSTIHGVMKGMYGLFNAIPFA